MAELISTLRGLIGDPSGSGAVFTDQELQDFLDNWRIDVFNRRLDEQATITTGGAVSYKDFYSDLDGFWETGEVLQDGSYGTVTATTADHGRGHWNFGTAQTSLPLHVTGSIYDVYGAAVDTLQAWAAKLMLEFDFTADGAQFNRSQKFKQVQAMIKTYSAQMQPSIAQMIRSDTP